MVFQADVTIINKLVHVNIKLMKRNGKYLLQSNPQETETYTKVYQDPD